MESAIYEVHELVARAGGTTDPNRPPIYKVVGLCLAIASGLFIGTSFVLKKVGLLKANDKYNEVAGEGYGYLKNWYWWTGMTLMIVGEICNFVAYAFVDAILVTPLGALSVVVTTILSAIFLKERLSFVGKVGCFNCIIGSVVIVLNAPTQSAVADIQDMQHFVISPGFLSYAGVVIVTCIFVALWAGPRYGKKSMLVYLSICSLIGGLSVVATQGLGSAIVAQAGGKPQFNQWFLYVLLVFVVATLLTEIIYLNKALNIFNAALVTPTYYVMFTSATIVTSAILFRGFKGTAISITTVVMGFLQICTGVVLLQLSKSSKDVPDAAVLNGDLDQIRQVGEQEQPETEPKADAIRGAAALVRRFSSARQKMEQKEFERLHQEKMQDQLEPVGENEVVQWDGIRRRKTVIGNNPLNPIVRRKTLHPPLGMAYFPDEQGDEESGRASDVRSRASTIFSFQRQQSPKPESTIRPVPLTEIIVVNPDKSESTEIVGAEAEAPHTFGLPAALRRTSNRPLWSPRSKPLPPHPESSPQPGVLSPPNSARRQWSFTNFMGRNRSPTHVDGAVEEIRPNSRADIASRGSQFSREKKLMQNATEEERLGLVKGDSAPAFPDLSPDRLPVYPHPDLSPSHSQSTSTFTASTSSRDDHDISSRGRLLTDHHKRAHSTVFEESDISDAYQMTNRPDSDTLASNTRTAIAIALAAQTARSTTRRTVAPPPTAATPYNYERRGTRGRLGPSPPPTYRQAQAQAQATMSPIPEPASSPLPPSSATIQPLQAVNPEENRGSGTDLPPAPAVMSQARRGRVLERGSAQIVQVSDRSRSSSMSRSRTRTFGEENKGKDVTPIEEQDERSEGSASQPTQAQSVVNHLGGFVFERPITLYEGEGYGSPLAGEMTPPVPPVHRSPDVVDTQASETKDRFQAQSRREREKRRMRMSMVQNGNNIGGAL